MLKLQTRLHTLALALVLFALAPHAAALAQESRPTIGVCIYNMDDTFMASLQGVIARLAEGEADMLFYDSQNNQNTQNNQVDELLSRGVDALIVNPVDRTASVYLVQMAMQRDTPIIFINREPLREDLAQYDKAYYVGIDPKQQGYLAGTLVAEYFRAEPKADLNGDGKLQLVLFKGEPGHQDAELRTIYALQALSDQGVEVELLSEEVAMWQRVLGQERMAALLNAHGDSIECVISNNDEMALGAIDALKAAGYFSGDKYMPVFGNDATTPAMEALRQGSLYGTVYNNANSQGAAALSLALLLAGGEAVNGDSFSYPMEDKVVYIDSIVFTKDVLVGN